MTLSNTHELKEDVLFRASEALSGSKYDTPVIGYLNRTYRTLCTGASEFLPEYVEDWWWLRGSAAFNLEPVHQEGFVSVTVGSPTVTFSVAPAISLAGRRLWVQQSPDIPLIASHTAGSATATLDVAWSGETKSALYKAMKVEYTLSSAVQAIMSPMILFRDPGRVPGLSPERMDELYPLGNLSHGVPRAFALENDRVVRFSHGGSDEGEYWRVEYRYRLKVEDLTDSPSSIPLVPVEWRHLLSDMALTYLLLDKNDDRSNAVALSARTGLAAMLKENRRRNVKIDPNAGRIVTRPT